MVARAQVSHAEILGREMSLSPKGRTAGWAKSAMVHGMPRSIAGDSSGSDGPESHEPGRGGRAQSSAAHHTPANRKRNSVILRH